MAERTQIRHHQSWYRFLGLNSQSAPSTPTLGGRLWRDRKFKLKEVNKTNLMFAILTSPGPVCCLRCITNNGPTFLRHIRKQQFIEASMELADLEFGKLISLRTVQKSPHVFIKKAPHEVVTLLKTNADLLQLDFWEYKEFFKMPLAKTLQASVRTELETNWMTFIIESPD